MCVPATETTERGEERAKSERSMKCQLSDLMAQFPLFLAQTHTQDRFFFFETETPTHTFPFVNIFLKTLAWHELLVILHLVVTTPASTPTLTCGSKEGHHQK